MGAYVRVSAYVRLCLSITMKTLISLILYSPLVNAECVSYQLGSFKHYIDNCWGFTTVVHSLAITLQYTVFGQFPIASLDLVSVTETIYTFPYWSAACLTCHLPFSARREPMARLVQFGAIFLTIVVCSAKPAGDSRDVDLRMPHVHPQVVSKQKHTIV